MNTTKTSTARKGAITNRNGIRFEAMIFDSRVEAEAYGMKHPELRRRKGGGHLRYPAPVHNLTNGTFAVIA